MKSWSKLLGAVLALALLAPAWAQEEDGYDLWLRYRPLAGAERAAVLRHARTLVAPAAPSPTVQAALDELRRGVQGMTGRAPTAAGRAAAGAIVLGTPASLPAALRPSALAALGREGYVIRRMAPGVTVIAANTDTGLLYGAFAWLRAVGTGVAPDRIDERAVPKLQLRVLNHWDNLDRTVERGYAGESIWDWWALPDVRERRYVDYARANASLGINGAVLNNVNAKPEILTAPWIAKTAALADVLRPYGIRVYLSARFSTPLELQETDTADPLAPEVAAWWRRKADEIYRAIPDFGGFLVKANSEGQPGPQDYRRSHADGANMLAAAVAPHGGVVMWRAFVYAAENPVDRARQAYDEFQPLDGKFAPNVLVQVKNGPIDFQPREPFHPLFGAMPKTPLMLEFQITKEYLGYATHLAYLGPLFEETLRSETGRKAAQAAAGLTVAQVIEGAQVPGPLTGMAGVANIGSARTWSGSHFDQANWYAFGRLAWDPQASSRAIAREWAAQTFTRVPRALDDIVALMMDSREAVVNYMTPLGLHHIMGTGHHHGPAPWVADLARPEWNPVYYHKADRGGIGFDRTSTGSNALAQYAPGVAQRYADPRTTPETLLLWFHRLPWDHPMPSGRTLWAELAARYDLGVTQARGLRTRWAALAPFVDVRRHAEVAARLDVQAAEAQWWRDACLAYFQSVSGLPLPPGVRPPAQPLEYYKALRFPYAPGHG
ncbi:alpha-glucuronidase family glycosyl hydrolase [Pseudoduganella chitinolytica]|uniref:Xylan alpha-1,2-glucuronidase n=1 Tax=Pseudoduganella chitinolytica TaxID=34070 RepID=A0ABY8BM13_9BURK|nr:alpha-glucuronidase family glycosyl hydrolase [Pseudoduganella chitinolytica]WEF35722.1 alpha-glucuronidase family glycosyl hydrolase [Pseudoduganella chitinolytica]